MKLGSVSNTSFKSYVPVRIYARNKGDTRFHRVYNNPDNNHFKRCQRQIVSNLNGTAKEPNKDFIENYKQVDRDYASTPAARSFYPGASAIYLVTGHDVDGIITNAKRIGKAKSESVLLTGSTKTNYTKNVVKDYIDDSNKYLKRFSTILKNEYRQPLILKVYFEAERNKKGEVKKFKLLGSNFVVDSN